MANWETEQLCLVLPPVQVSSLSSVTAIAGGWISQPSPEVGRDGLGLGDIIVMANWGMGRPQIGIPRAGERSERVVAIAGGGNHSR